MINLQTHIPVSATLCEHCPTTGDKYGDAALQVIYDLGATFESHVVSGFDMPFSFMAVLSNMNTERGLGYEKVSPVINEAVKNMQKLGWFVDTGRHDSLKDTPFNKVWNIQTDFDMIRECLAKYLNITAFNIAGLMNANGIVLLHQSRSSTDSVNSDDQIKASTAFLAGMGLVQQLLLHAHYPTKPTESFKNAVSFIGDLLQINAMSELWGLLYPDELGVQSVHK